MLEFGYDGAIMEMFTPFGIDQSHEQWPMWVVTKDILPRAYWALMVNGYVPWREVPRVGGAASSLCRRRMLCRVPMQCEALCVKH